MRRQKAEMALNHGKPPIQRGYQEVHEVTMSYKAVVYKEHTYGVDLAWMDMGDRIKIARYPNAAHAQRQLGAILLDSRGLKLIITTGSVGIDTWDLVDAGWAKSPDDLDIHRLK